MFPRRLRLPERSFFLFGPRGTGRTTWLHSVLPDAHWVNLLLDRELLRLMRDPGRFSEEVQALPARRWRHGDESGLVSLGEERPLKRSFGVYLGNETFRVGRAQVLPLAKFLGLLSQGEVLG